MPYHEPNHDRPLPPVDDDYVRRQQAAHAATTEEKVRGEDRQQRIRKRCWDNDLPYRP